MEIELSYILLEHILIEKHNLTYCNIVETKTGRLDIIVEPNLTSESQVLIEETTHEYFGDNWQGLAIAYNKKEYELMNSILILTKDDLVHANRNTPFCDVSIYMFPKEHYNKYLKASKVIYRIDTGVEDFPYANKILKDREGWGITYSR